MNACACVPVATAVRWPRVGPAGVRQQTNKRGEGRQRDGASFFNGQESSAGAGESSRGLNIAHIGRSPSQTPTPRVTPPTCTPGTRECVALQGSGRQGPRGGGGANRLVGVGSPEEMRAF